MVTLNSADSALKSFYLDAVSESLNMKTNPFLAKIEKTANYVTGKDVRKTMRIGVNGGVGAGSETGNLPTPRDAKYIQMATTLKNMYGTIEISDKAIRSSANNEGAFVNLLNEEMQSLVKSASHNVSRMLFGDGSGYISEIVSAEGSWIYVDNVQNFAVGMYIDVEDAPDMYKNKLVLDVDYKNKGVLLDTVYIDPDDIIGLSVSIHGSSELEITGLKAIFNDDPLYGVDRSQMGMKPYIDNDFGVYDEAKLEKAIDEIEANSGYRVDYVICSWGVRRAIKDYYRQYNIDVKMIEIDGGFKAMEILGIPFVVDRFCPEGTMYLLSSEHFKLCQLCDWQWLEAEDGKILKQVPGKPVYTATLVKYAELICENPSAQGMLKGIVEV